jgi:hypothetical protein
MPGTYLASQDGLAISTSNPLPTQLTGSNAKQPFSGSTTVTHTFTSPMKGFIISNDGAADLTFTIGTDTYTVKAGEVFEEGFDAFTQVMVTTTVPFRAYGRG